MKEKGINKKSLEVVNSNIKVTKSKEGNVAASSNDLFKQLQVFLLLKLLGGKRAGVRL